MLYAQSTGTVISGQGQKERQSPSLISRMVSVDVKHHVYLLTREAEVKLDCTLEVFLIESEVTQGQLHLKSLHCT